MDSELKQSMHEVADEGPTKQASSIKSVLPGANVREAITASPLPARSLTSKAVWDMTAGPKRKGKLSSCQVPIFELDS